MSEWQPIETAPRDGGLILAVDLIDMGGGSFGEVVAARWSEAHPDDDWESGWNAVDLITGDSIYGCNLTHWMPLPAPPKTEDGT